MANDRRRIKSVLIGIVLGLWALLLGVAVVWGLQNAENDIESRVAAALGEAGIGLDEIRVEGRDVFLAGIANEQRASAEQLVSSVRGVRVVEMNDLPDVVIVGGSTTTVPGDSSTSTTVGTDPGGTTSTQAPTTAAPVAANVSASLDKGVLTLSGAVPDQESAARIAALADLIYGPFVEGTVEVNPELESASWVPNAARVISVLPIVSTSGVQLTGETATVSGAAPTAERKAQLEGALRQILGEDVAIESSVSADSLEAPTLAASAPGDGTVVISGVVPSEEVAQRIIGAATSVYGEGNVVSTVEVRDGVAEMFSLFRVPLVFVQFAPVPQWEFSIDDDVITGALRGGATFEYGSAQLSDQLVVLLDTAAGILLRNPTLVGTVEGHTDDLGGTAFNQQLSEQRAQAAVDYLIAAGVDPARLIAVGYGETRPIGDNNTAEGRTINRRIEFFLGPAPEGGA